MEHTDVSRLDGIRFYGSSSSQFINVMYPRTQADAYPLVVILHGGFWKCKYGINPPTSACETIAPDLRDHGFVAVEVEYRRDGDEQWGWPYTNNDVMQAFKAALKIPLVDESKVFLVGHSAGGTLALWLAARLYRDEEKVLPKHIYALAPVADLREAVRVRLSDEGNAVSRYMHGTPECQSSQYDEACPTHAAAELACLNLTLVAGENDTDVPATVVQRLHNAIRNSATRTNAALLGTTTFDVLPATDHYDLVSASTSAWKLIRRDMVDKVRRPLRCSASYRESNKP